mgnify:CR=1 FL=1|jgi:LPS export ABC transporter permease LptG
MLVSRYLFREWGKSFLLATLALVGLQFFSDLYNELPGFLDRGGTVGETVRFFLYRLPGYLPPLLPLAFLLSVLWTLARFQQHGEIVALRASGLSLAGISRPLWLAAVLLALAMLALNALVVPLATRESRTIKETLKESLLTGDPDRVQGNIRAQAVYLESEQQLWFTEVFRRTEETAYGVRIDWLADGRPVRRIEAARARYAPRRQGWILENGRTLTWEDGSSLPARASPFGERLLLDTSLTPTLLASLARDPRDLSLPELQAVIEEMPAGVARRPYVLRQYAVLGGPLQLFVVLLLALPAALGSNRQRPAAGFFRAAWLYLLFFLFVQLVGLAGGSGLLPAAATLWFPLAVALGAGGYLYRRYA